ncbi:MAG: TlpA family protein disulfide reductase [Pyrinomonadaceae bacterium]|nr:TlpA family protein disulfide reductase [Pyrinomonadaceae bacterium]
MNSSIHGHKRQPSQRFWTARRLTLSFITLALLATLGVSSCTQPETPATTTNANIPPAPGSNTASVKNQPASGNSSGAPSTNAAPPSSAGPLRSIPLPAALLDTPLTTIDGKSLKFSDYKGKVVVINLWASWCGPCRVETPELIEMSKEYKSQGVEFVGLTTKGNDPDIEPIKEFVREQQVPYKTVWDDGRFAGPLTQAVRARAVIPQSFVLLRDGSIYKHFEGFNQIETPKKLRQAIEEAVNSKS